MQLFHQSKQNVKTNYENLGFNNVIVDALDEGWNGYCIHYMSNNGDFKSGVMYEIYHEDKIAYINIL